MEPRARQIINGNGVQLERPRNRFDFNWTSLSATGSSWTPTATAFVTAAEIEQEATKQADQASRDWLGTILPQLVPMTLDRNGDGRNRART